MTHHADDWNRPHATKDHTVTFNSARATTAFASLAMLVAALGAPFKWW